MVRVPEYALPFFHHVSSRNGRLVYLCNALVLSVVPSLGFEGQGGLWCRICEGRGGDNDFWLGASPFRIPHCVEEYFCFARVLDSTSVSVEELVIASRW